MRHDLKIILFCAFALFALPALAQKSMDEFKPPMIKLELLPENEFLEKTELHKEVPMNIEELAYEVRLPVGWKKITDSGLGNFSLSRKVVGEISRFYSPAMVTSERSRFTVEAVGLEYKLTAEQWLLQHLLTNGYSIQGFRTYNENKAEALFVLIENDISFAVRGVAELNGKNIVLAQYFMQIDRWNEENVMQEQVVSTFKLKNSQSESVEDMLKYQFLDIAQIQYPRSWKIYAPRLESIDRMQAQILNVTPRSEESRRKYLDGKITIDLVSTYVADSMDVEVNALKKRLADEGILIKEPVAKELTFRFHDLFDFAKVEAFRAANAESKMIDYEFWIASGLAGDYYYMVTLLTPSRKQDYFIWSRNTQTFKLFLEMITPTEEAMSGQDE